MSLTPSGRLSAIETDKGVLQIQTEFTLTPAKNIVTSHIFSGRVLRKQQTPWPHILEKEEDRRQAEESLARQHKQEVQFAVAHCEELITPLLEEIERVNTDKKLEDLKKKISPIAGVKKILLLDQDWDYLVIKNNGGSGTAREIEFVRQNMELCQIVSSVTRMGRPVQLSAQLKDGQHFLQAWGDKYVLFETGPECDLNRLKTAIQLALAGV
jgi:hypothetical protein